MMLYPFSSSPGEKCQKARKRREREFAIPLGVVVVLAALSGGTGEKGKDEAAINRVFDVFSSKILFFA